jgi:general secretion pathway protein K
VALLAVLWLSTALSLLALTTAYLVRTEAETVANRIEAEREYYLARGGVEAAVYALTRPRGEQGAPGVEGATEFRPGQRWLRFAFAQGAAVVEVVPENAKLSVNQVTPEQLTALFAVLGEPAAQSRELAEAIADWRASSASTVASGWDLFYASLQPPYAARHAPFEELEELLAVKGMTRELFFGRLVEMPDGSWKKLPPLGDLLTTEAGFGAVNVNYAAREVLLALPGWEEAMADAVIQARAQKPFESFEELQAAVPGIAGVTGLAPLTLAPSTSYTLTATGELPGSTVRRSVRARVRMGGFGAEPHRVVAWWDDWPWSAGDSGDTETPAGDIALAR